MDQPKSDKFSELSPVLELVYVMLTNMAKYVDVYANDIQAEKIEQYAVAQDALRTAIARFDEMYGLQSPSSTPLVEDTEVEPVPAQVAAPVEAVAPVAPQEQSAYEFASGNDPESLKKAKQAVEELKTLFADMKNQESAVQTSQEPAPVTLEAPADTLNPTTPMPTFVTPPTQPQATTTELPSPMNTPSASQDASEIDSILKELKNLQNKGTQQL
ncbi:MAG: hypothetical protein ACOYT9_03775 [Patescibacteria group bacterium]